MPKKLNENEAIKRIKQECQNTNMTFIGFKNEENKYENIKTKLILQCNTCGKIIDNIQYKYFVNGKRKIHTCVKKINPVYGFKKAEQYINCNLNQNDYELLKIEGNNYNNYTLYIHCKKCDNVFTYTYPQFRIVQGKIKCKHCHQLLNNDKVIQNI